MNHQTDSQLLRAYAENHSETAFAELVRRHVDFVYSAARRMVVDPHLAEDVTQSVFVAFAKNAAQLSDRPVLSGWLHRTAQNIAAQAVRTIERRRAREQEAVTMNELLANETDADWENIAPHLDAALGELSEPDRDALLLRYFERKSAREMSAILNVSEEAAQKRVNRAVERLRELFSKRNVTIGASGLTVLISANAVQAAPIGLAASAVAASLATVGSGSVFLYKLMGVSKIKLTVATLAITALPLAWQWNELRAARQESAQLEVRRTGIQDEFSTLQTELEKLRNTSVRLDSSLAGAETAASLESDKAQKYEAWKEQLRERLLSPEYHWPEDSPFVRIPKSILPQLRVRQSILPSGSIKQEARELLGLAPAERKQLENALQRHFAEINNLMSSQLYETNKPARINIPKSVVASKVWGVPALGEAAKMSADELQSDWKNLLGNERWPYVAEQLRSSGTDVLRNALNLDANKRGQELATWIVQNGNEFSVLYGWDDHNSMSTRGGAHLSWFLEESDWPSGMENVDEYFGALPEALTRPALEWIRQQATTRLGEKGGQ